MFGFHIHWTRVRRSSGLCALMLLSASTFAQTPRTAIPRTPTGKPDLQGIWQTQSRASYDLQDHVARDGMPAGKGVVVDGEIPYQSWAAAKKLENFANRKTADPVGKCFLPGVPRIMYMEFPFQIFQTPEHVAMTFEWSQVHRLIYTNGKPGLHPIEAWMGNSRGHWEGDTLVVDVTGHNDKTWFDRAGNFHSDALKLAERYTMTDADTIQYEVTVQDTKVFTKPWQIRTFFARQKQVDRLLEYQCQAEAEEANGAFERDLHTWYPPPGAAIPAREKMPESGPLKVIKTGTNLPRRADGKPDLTGYYNADGGGANYGLEYHTGEFLTPDGRGVIVDPPDGKLPYQPWAKAERLDRVTPPRGYDDPTAHCFVGGVPRSIYAPAPMQILQPPGYVVFLFERMAWRLIPMQLGRKHLPDNLRLWMGDSLGHWEGDTLVVETKNLNGKTWLNEAGDVVSHAEQVVERFIPVDANKIIYRATITDPIAYTRPWTIEMPLNKEAEELLEVACHEDNGDMQHLKDVRDDFRAKQKKEK